MPAVPVETSADGATATVRPSGTLDMSTSPVLREALLEACRGPAAHVVVDLGRVTFADSTALSILITAYRRLTAEGRTFALTDVQPTTMRLFTTTGLARILSVTPAAGPAPQQRTPGHDAAGRPAPGRTG